MSIFSAFRPFFLITLPNPFEKYHLSLVTIRKRSQKAISYQVYFRKTSIQINEPATTSSSFGEQVVIHSIKEHRELFYIVLLLQAAYWSQYWDLEWTRYLYARLGVTTSLEKEADLLWTGICMYQ
jgi:hypothetical protein